MALDMTVFLGTLLCLVTADGFKLVCQKRSHFNQKNRNAFFFFFLGGRLSNCLGDFHLCSCKCGLRVDTARLLSLFSVLLGQLSALAECSSKGCLWAPWDGEVP